MKKALKPIIITVSIILLTAVLTAAGFALFYYDLGDIDVVDIPIINSENYLTGYVEEGVLDTTVYSGVLFKEKAEERIKFVNKNQMALSEQFLERFGDYTQIECRIKEVNRNKIVLDYIGEGCEKDTMDRYTVNIHVEYNLGLFEEPTVEHTPSYSGNALYVKIED